MELEKELDGPTNSVGSSDDTFVTSISNELMKMITEDRQRLFT